MTKRQVLVVEDNAELSQSIRTHLQSLFTVTQAATLSQTYSLLETEPPFDIILLDRQLPDGDGLSLVPTLEKLAPQTRICVLSQKDALAEKLYGFSQGVDVYLCKPIALSELKAQMFALTRRGRVYQDHVLQRGPLQLDTASHTLSTFTSHLQLTARESAIMTAFLDHPHGFLSKGQLYDLFWELGHEPNTSVVHVCMQRLRQKIKPL